MTNIIRQRPQPVSPDYMLENLYNNAQSPSSISTKSDETIDSGRSTGGSNNSRRMPYREICSYEFEVPNTLVGLIIGIQGRTILVKILINPHRDPIRAQDRQICSIEGPRTNVNKCLHMIRLRFPAERFPDLNIRPLIPLLPAEIPSGRTPVPSTLCLPNGAPCEVYLSSVIDVGHFFVQLPAHPTFSSLANFNSCITNIYNQVQQAPLLPASCEVGAVCVVSTCNGWLRAIVLRDDESETVDVRLADYGGFLQVARGDIRQIRSDLVSWPMQAIECHLAHVEPVDGTSRWTTEARALFESMCSSGMVNAELLGWDRTSGVPYVGLTIVNDSKMKLRVDTVLLDNGLAKPMDPTRMVAKN